MSIFLAILLLLELIYIGHIIYKICFKDLIEEIKDRRQHYKNPNNWEDRMTGMSVAEDGKLKVQIKKCYKGYN